MATNRILPPFLRSPCAGMVLVRHVVAIVAAGISTAHADDQGARPVMPDRYCGPRVVQTVLGHYGRQAELLTLVREIQWPDLERGSPFSGLDRALRSRGVHTRAVRLKSSAYLTSPNPVIVHMKGDSGDGHFAVWCPSIKSGYGEVLNAGISLPEMPADEFFSRLSGPVLLTSDKPLDDTGSLVRSDPSRWHAAALQLTTVTLMTFCAVSVLSFVFRKVL